MSTRNNKPLSQDSAGSPSPSPFQNRSMAAILDDEANPKKRRIAPECKIIVITTDCEDLCGFIMHIDHFAETSIFTPFYHRQVPGNMQYLREIGCVPLVMDVKTADAGIFGDTVMIRTPKYPGQRIFNMKGMVVMINQDSTDSEIEQWFHGTFIPNLKNTDIEPHNIPTIQAPAEWRREDAWSKALLPKHWTHIVRTVSDLKTPRMSVEQFFKADKANYTAIYPVGTAPDDFLQMYKFKPEHLYTEDMRNDPNLAQPDGSDNEPANDDENAPKNAPTNN